jgi:hypothetical protein
MKYDDASWHYDGDFPTELPTEAGATHIGMFVAWCMLHDMAGPLHTDEFPDELYALKERRTTPAQFVITACDEKLTDEELSDEGNAFAIAYYGSSGYSGQYLTDYEQTLARGEETLYQIEDSWENYDKLSPVIDRRFAEWKEGKLAKLESRDFNTRAIRIKRPWWKLW